MIPDVRVYHFPIWPGDLIVSRPVRMFDRRVLSKWLIIAANYPEWDDVTKEQFQCCIALTQREVQHNQRFYRNSPYLWTLARATDE